MGKIIVRFGYDRWEVIHRYGYREELLAWRKTRAEARKAAAEYKKFFRELEA